MTEPATPNDDIPTLDSVESERKKLIQWQNYETRYLYPTIPFDRVPFYLNLIVESCKIDRIEIEYADGHIGFLPRCRIHGYLCAEIGSLKSTTLDQLRACYPDDVVFKDYVSYAAMVGTTDKETKTSVIPLAVRADGKVLVMDERAKEEGGNLNTAMLQLMERGEYSRDLAIPPKFDRNEFEGRFIIDRKTGTLTIKSKPAFIYASMYSPAFQSRTQFGQALLNRCLVLNYVLSKEQKREFLKNPHPLYWDMGFNPPSVVRVSKSDYEYIYNFWVANDVSENGDLRKADDLIRCFAVLGKHDDKVYAEILKIGTPTIHKVSKRNH